MNNYKVLTELCALANLDASDAEEYLPVCRASIKKIENRLKDGADANDERLIYAAATLAYYHLSLIKSSDAISSAQSITVGDVTVNNAGSGNGNASKSAKALYEDAMACVTDLLESDGTFFFRSV